MVIVTLRFKILPERRNDFLTSARLLAGPTQILPSCISCRFYEEIENPDVILLVEEWKSRSDLEHHIASDKYRILLSLMEFSVEPPKIKFNTVSSKEGIEVIEAVRV